MIVSTMAELGMAGGECSIDGSVVFPGGMCTMMRALAGRRQGGLLGAGGGTLYGRVHKNNQEYETLTCVVCILGATRDS
jgi:hypothetical protein